MNKLLYLLLALVTLAYFTDFQVFWGFDSLRYLDTFLSVILLLTVLILLLPPINRKINDWLIENLPRLGVVPWFVYIIIIAILFYFFRQEGFFLGDGLLRIRDLQTGQIYFAAEPFDLLLHTYLFKIFNKLFNADGKFIYATISIVSGIVSIIFSIHIIKKISVDIIERTLLWLMILSSGTIQLFFGYAESYSIINAILLPCLLYSVFVIREKRFSFIPLILWITSIFFHPIMLIFLPSVVYLYYYLISHSENKSRLFLSAVGISLLIISFSIITLLYLGVKIDDLNRLMTGSHIKPLFSNEKGYGLLSFYTLIDLFNLIILVVPSVLLIFSSTHNFRNIGAKASKTVLLKLDSHIIFLLLSIITSLIFIIFFQSGIGFSRDWDLFAIIGFPSTILLYFVLKSLKYDIKELLLPVIIMVLVLTAPWIITNSIHNSALKRAVSMAESPGWSNHQRAILLDEISHYYSSIGNLEAAIRFSEKSYQYQKNERVLYSLGLMYFNNADYNRAFESFALLKPSNYKQKYVLMMLGDISFKLENFQSAIDSYKQYLQIDSLNHGIYFNTGMAYYQMNKLDSALIYFKASSFLNQTHIQSLNMTAQIYSDIGFLDSAITYYEELVSIDPANPEFYFNLALCYSDMKLFDKALNNAIKAKSKGISSQNIDGLITELNKYIGGQVR